MVRRRNYSWNPEAKLTQLERKLGVRVVVEPRALILLQDFTEPTLDAVVRSITRWAGDEEVTGVRVTAVEEPDDPGWEEVVFQIGVEADTERAINEWRRLSEMFDKEVEGLDEASKERTYSDLGLILVWGALAETD